MHFLQMQKRMQKITSAEMTASAITAHFGSPVASPSISMSLFAIEATYFASWPKDFFWGTLVS